MVVGSSFQVFGMDNYNEQNSIKNSTKSKHLFNDNYSFNPYLANTTGATIYLQESEEENKELMCSSSSSPDSSDDETGDEHWNKYGLKFNKILNELCFINKTGNHDDQVNGSFHKWEALHKIGESFVDNATLYGRIIIREYRLPDHEKTIKPVAIGGIAGGDKYIAQGILFKFAKDKQVDNNTWLYGGTNQRNDLAAKSAGQELLSANYVGSFDPLIKVPLMAVVDYWGERLMATALLPIEGENTLVYGSANGGRTIYSSSETIRNKLESLGKKLNLQKHMVKGFSMALCGDVEVHACNLGKGETQYYCLDTARVFPPEAPMDLKTPNSIFYEKLRPEFVKRFKIPLSSDGLTGWQRTDTLCGIYDENILGATKYLWEEEFNSCIKGFNTNKIAEIVLRTTSKYYVLDWSNHDYIPNPLISYLHQHGINLRHLGDILKSLETNYGLVSCSSISLNELKKHIYNVMIARVVKNEARRTLREDTAEETDYKDKLIYFMNLLACKNPEREVFWQETVPLLLKSKFRVIVHDLSQQIHQGFLLLNFCKLSGVILNPKIFDKIAKQYHEKMFFEFCTPDILDIKPKIKYLNTIDLASGFYFLNMSNKNDQKNLRISMDYLQKARDRLLTSLSTSCNESHPIFPDHLAITVNTIKKRIIDHQLQWQIQIAEQGDVEAQFNLGMRYSYGQDVPMDNTEGFKWCARAAEQGHVEAQMKLAQMYENGQGVPKSLTEAVKWYTKSGEQGCANAQYVLGTMYEYGRGVPQNYTEAVKWYSEGAEQGNVAAQYILGRKYREGQGVDKNLTKAAECFRKAAEQGHADAQYNLGLMYDNGQGVPQSNKEAVKWYTKAAEQGHLVAQYNLGEESDDGQGVSQNHTETVEWDIKAAEKDNTGVQEKPKKLSDGE